MLEFGGLLPPILMRQLPLQISQPAERSFDNFIAGENAEALARVRQLASGELREAIVYRWGGIRSGCTHLLRAGAHANASLTVADDGRTPDPGVGPPRWH